LMKFIVSRRNPLGLSVCFAECRMCCHVILRRFISSRAIRCNSRTTSSGTITGCRVVVCESTGIGRTPYLSNSCIHTLGQQTRLDD
jgi:hypothetical protein